MYVVFSEAADLGVSAATDDRLEAWNGEADGDMMMVVDVDVHLTCSFWRFNAQLPSNWIVLELCPY